MPISFSSPANRDTRARGAGVTAVLGPTNTGKTHLAIERMLAHSSGMIGLPLRLLAREVYNKVADRIGVENAALITGEEKIKPPNPRFWISTVEAMPRDLDVAFVAVDEIQLGADLDRGHMFTDRMLNRRGREETLILGAATMRPIVERLLPGANIVSRSRLSQLTFAGDKKTTRLPRRSAIVAFSAEEVYAIAELIKRQRGGAAVVLGSLSPRTRNAQVDLFQSGDVEYLVATDAIGMGLNLDVDHVAFAADRKFDGYRFRKLNIAEMAQIAGRAGRATRDGTFGTTGRCPPFDHEMVQALESHSFEPIRVLQWRNTDLDFSSIGALQASLSATPGESGLTRAPIGEDIVVLEHAAREDDVRAMATGRAAVERLWDVCQIPDYRKIAPAHHAELAVTLYGFLLREGKIPDEWFARQVTQADRTDGDIDTLSTRIAHVRTWTFVANRPDWLADPEHWQAVARGVEDKLSDALHERLIERFVDRRTSVLMRRLRDNVMLEPEISKTGEVIVEGHVIGRLEGFSFAPDATSGGTDAKALQGAAQKALAGEIDARAAKLSQAPNDQFILAVDGTIRWIGEAVAKITAGDEALRPRIRIIADEQLTGASRDIVQTRLDLWLKTHIEKLLAPLFSVSAADDVTGMARGVAFQLVEALGVLERQKVSDEVKGLDQEARSTLRKYGVRFGAYHIYFPQLLKPAPRSLAAQLWLLKRGPPDATGLDTLQHLAASGRTSIPVDAAIEKQLYRSVGYRVCGERAIRVDILERLADLIRPVLTWREGAIGDKPAGAFDGRGFTVTPAMTSLTGASGEDFASILRSLGYRLDRRPKPPEPAPAPPQATAEPAGVAPAGAEPTDAESTDEATPAADAGTSALPGASAESADITTADGAVPQQNGDADAKPAAAATDPASSSQLLATPEFVAAEPAPPQPAIDASDSNEAAHNEAAPAAANPDHAASDGASESVAADSAPSADTAPANAEAIAAEPVLIDVWRPGGRRDDKPPQQRRRPRPRHAHAAPAPTAAAEPAVAAEPSAPETPSSPPGRDQDGRPPRQGRKQRSSRPPRGTRPQRNQRPDRSDKDHTPYASSRPDRRDTDKPPDPNSPFAKLLALKEQLEANKERR